MGAGSVELELSLTFVQFLQHNKIRFAAKLMPLRTEKKRLLSFCEDTQTLKHLEIITSFGSSQAEKAYLDK